MEPSTLGSIVVKEGLKRAGISSDKVDEVIMGSVLQGGLGQKRYGIASLCIGDEMGEALIIEKL